MLTARKTFASSSRQAMTPDGTPPDRGRFPAGAGIARLSTREERAARAYLDPAHLAGATAVGGVSGSAGCDAAARPRRRGGTQARSTAGSPARWWSPSRPRHGAAGRSRGASAKRGAASCIGDVRVAPTSDWFRARIREAYGGRAPKVLDPFAGGGAIPLEAMRLGCQSTAIDINPVAWFILKCTLDYPRRLAGATLPLPDFVRSDSDFMEAFLKAKGFKGKDARSAAQRSSALSRTAARSSWR